MRSRDKPKPLYLHYFSAYDHETWEGVDLSRRARNHKVTQRSDHVVLQNHVTNENNYISATRKLMATKVGRMVADFESY